MNTPPDALSVVICAYTEARWSDLQAAVASVQRQDPTAAEIVVVIDYNPALLERAQAELTGVHVVANSEAQGLSGARNTGIAASTGSIIAFLDDDAAALPGWSRELLAPYADPDVLGVGGRVIPRWDVARPAWLPEEFDWVVGCTYAGHREDAGPVRNLIGANMSVRRAVVTEVGGFRHSLGRTASLPAGCEETEFFIRATHHFPTGRIWYQPDAAVTHRVPAARATAKYFRARCFAEGISKTQISRLVGSQDGLASERAYTVQAIPRAFAREMGRGARTLNASGVARAATLVTGVATTAGGYAAARFPGSDRWLPSRTGEPRRRARSRVEPSAVPSSFVPARVLQIDIADEIDALAAVDPASGRTYGRAVVLARHEGAPMGVIDLTFGADGVAADALAGEIERELGLDTLTTAARSRLAVPANGSNGNGSSNGNGNQIRVAAVRERSPAAVVIATRDRVDSLRRCLESLRRLDLPATEIVVVDNASRSRDTAELVHALQVEDPRFRYAREDRPGLARAHNCGIEQTRLPLIAFTDDDVVVDQSWLRHLVDGFERAPHVGCVTGMIFPLELETAAQDWLEQYAGFNKGFEPQLFDDDRRATDPLFPYAAGTFGSGANMAFRSDVLRGMRGFDPALGAGTTAKGGDDLAAFFDVIASGHAVAYEPGAIVYHQHHRTFEALSRQTYGYGAGLTAYLTKTIVERPTRLLEMAARAPRAVHHALSPSSAKNERLPDNTPPTLVRRERLGMLVGPALYLRSRLEARADVRPEPITEVIVLDEPLAPDPIDAVVRADLREASVAQ